MNVSALLQPSCPQAEHLKAQGCSVASTRTELTEATRQKPDLEGNSETWRECAFLLPHTAAWPGSHPPPPSFSFLFPSCKHLSQPSSIANSARVQRENHNAITSLLKPPGYGRAGKQTIPGKEEWNPPLNHRGGEARLAVGESFSFCLLLPHSHRTELLGGRRK